jgi:hypothetical protein
MPNLLINDSNQFDAAKKYTKTIFLSSCGLESAELNKIQDSANYAIKNNGNPILKDSGGPCSWSRNAPLHYICFEKLIYQSNQLLVRNVMLSKS